MINYRQLISLLLEHDMDKTWAQHGADVTKRMKEEHPVRDIAQEIHKKRK